MGASLQKSKRPFKILGGWRLQNHQKFLEYIGFPWF